MLERFDRRLREVEAGGIADTQQVATTQDAGPTTRSPQPRPSLTAAAAPAASTTTTSVGRPPGARPLLGPHDAREEVAAAQAAGAKGSPPRPSRNAAVVPAASTTRSRGHSPRPPTCVAAGPPPDGAVAPGDESFCAFGNDVFRHLATCDEFRAFSVQVWSIAISGMAHSRQQDRDFQEFLDRHCDWLVLSLVKECRDFAQGRD